MHSSKPFMIVAAAVVLATSLATTDASARGRIVVHRNPDQGLSAWDFCGGRLPGYGTDACGYREVQHGIGSCWRRLPDRPYHRGPRRVWICG